MGRAEIFGQLHADQRRMRGQRGRGLDVSGRKAVLRFVVTGDGISPGPVVPGDMGGDKAQIGAQVAAGRLQSRAVGAVSVQYHQPGDAGAADRGSDIVEHAQQRSGRQRQRAGPGPVFGAFSDGMHRKRQNRQRGVDQRQGAGRDWQRQVPVDRQRQVRPVLLDGTDGQDRHPLRAVQRPRWSTARY